LWIRLTSVAVPEYARLNTGESITRGNSGNGALLTGEIRAGREHKHGPNEALRKHDAVIRVYDESGNVIETHEYNGNFKEW
jgi:hypothetical protein